MQDGKSNVTILYSNKQRPLHHCPAGPSEPSFGGVLLLLSALLFVFFVDYLIIDKALIELRSV